ncbi:retrotransposon protein, putative, ty1-copia subclass [Tanacetum coccineum]|uniref:Retrotransposon protein, putative, ty1-copia subclass n=1 Tax=Tanacetum coccineum TaxID=301880 RepID=A0ABQ4WU08_9ASTR
MVPFISGYARFPHSGIFIVTSSIWGSIDREVDVLKSQGVDLISHCKRRIGTNKVCSVASKFQDSIVSSFRRQVRGGAENSQFAQLQELVGPTILSNSADRWRIMLRGGPKFSVVLIINVLAWKVSLDRLPTRLNLISRGVTVSSSSCPVCDSAPEDLSHLLFSCSMASDVYRLVCRWWNIGCPSIGSYSDWLSMVLFLIRNQLLFADKKPRKDTFFDDIVALSFLWYEKKIKFVEQPTGPALDPETANPNSIDKYYETINLEQEVACLMLSIKAFHACKQEEGQSVSSYLLKMKSYLDTLERIGYVMPNELGVSLILNSLNKDYDQFVQNYNMHSIGKTIAELHAMLKLHEKGIPKKAETLVVVAIWEGKIQKEKKKPRGQREVGHWRRNCPSYQAELKKRKNASMASTSGIFTIELYAFPNKTWVYDTSCGTHICNTLQGLRESRKLKHGALSLYMGNGMRATIEAIRSFDLIIPSGLIIVLDNCHFVPSVTMGVVSISHLVNNDMHNLYPNVSSMFNVSNKRSKHTLDSSYLWHCRLGYINKKHIDKLQYDGILQPTHNELLEKCKSCIYGKMARKPFSHQVEGAKDLVGLIHTDVCGPFRTMSREGASYFITFIDDFSHYGYVYLMKHKHEVFETFKLTPPYTPQHNGVSERRNRTLLDMVRSTMNLTTRLKSFWGYALESTARILNMVPTKKALVKRDAPDKLDPRSIKCIFVGYPKEIMDYYFYYPLENKIFVARNVEFFENILMVQEASGSHGLLESIPIHRSARIPQAPDKYSFYVDVKEYELGDLNEPPNYKAALSDPEFDKWLEAMNTEKQSMKDNQVWGLVDLPPNGRTVGSKWLFKKKTDMDGNQMDVKTAFLNGHQSKDVYMVQPEGFVDPKHPNKVCKLQRSIYGLKQASRSWNKRFDVEIKKIDFTQNPNESCVYLKSSGSNVAFLILYVDDILLMGNNVTMLQEVKSWLCKCFSMKYLGEAAYILGIKIIRNRSKWLIALSQSAYLEKILKRFWMENSKKGYTPMIEKPDYKKSQGAKTPSEVKRMQRVLYDSAIGLITYAVRSILKYLRNTKDIVLVYGAKPEAELKVSCHADATVDWKSVKQSTTAMSSTEAEYIVAAKASMEAVWMRKFIDGLGGVMLSIKRPMEMLCDNEPAIAIANDPGILKGARHFQRKYHYIREVIQECEIIPKKFHIYDNVADPFTKPMSYDKHYEHGMAIGIVPAQSLM